MTIIDTNLLFGLAALVSSVATLVWALRRRS